MKIEFETKIRAIPAQPDGICILNDERAKKIRDYLIKFSPEAQNQMNWKITIEEIKYKKFREIKERTELNMLMSTVRSAIEEAFMEAQIYPPGWLIEQMISDMYNQSACAVDPSQFDLDFKIDWEEKND